MLSPDLAFLVLHYRTTNETKELLMSIKLYYPHIYTLILDNGSPDDDSEELLACAPNRSRIVRISPNSGFACGMNEGIKVLLSEGFRTIACCSNDIVFMDSGSLSKLCAAFSDFGTAVVGPRILTPKGRDQSPLLLERPGPKEAKKMLKNYSLLSIYYRYILNNFLLNPIKNRLLKRRKYTPADNFPSASDLSIKNVYALNGAFFVLGPSFFKHYTGLDPHTYLYGEEIILGEMLHRANLKAAYVPCASVYHKEDCTSKLIWGGEDRIEPSLVARESVQHWYNEHYSK